MAEESQPVQPTVQTPPPPPPPPYVPAVTMNVKNGTQKPPK